MSNPFIGSWFKQAIRHIDLMAPSMTLIEYKDLLERLIEECTTRLIAVNEDLRGKG